LADDVGVPEPACVPYRGRVLVLVASPEGPRQAGPPVLPRVLTPRDTNRRQTPVTFANSRKRPIILGAYSGSWRANESSPSSDQQERRAAASPARCSEIRQRRLTCAR